jgi:LmbE family N-acetylglucosaminyl deacetylase
MKKIIIFISAAMLILLVLLFAHIIYIDRFIPSEEYPEDVYLSSIQVKRALVITAHDDDICAMSGTISKLSKAGWQIKQLCFDTGDDARSDAHLKASKYIMEEASFIDLKNLSYRSINDSMQYSWMPLPKEIFPDIYQKELIKKELIKSINDFKPSVIFSLDDQIGGYGHPDHVFISDLVLEICREDKRSVLKIYQSVFPDSYEEALFPALKNRASKYPSPYFTAKEMYNIDGMPEPIVQIDIYGNSLEKKLYLSSYLENEKRNIRKFLPYFEYYPHWFYFWLFDKEYFRVIEL